MCHWGLTVSPGELSKKSTRFATNNPWLAYQLALAQCDGLHRHRHLLGGLPALAQEYPEALCRCIAEATRSAVFDMPQPSFMGMENQETTSVNFHADEEEDPELNDGMMRTTDGLPPLTEAQKRLVHRVHCNTGHPPKERLLRAFRAAGALPQVIHYIKNEHHCDDCHIRQGPDNHRRAQLPRTFSFNKVVSLDFLYIRWRECSVAILNAVDLGTGYQVAVRSPMAEGTSGGTPTSQTAWNLFLSTWIRYLGAPQLVISDPGNEFRGAFARGLEHMGIMQHLTHPESPWENGRAERHGGWLKERLDKELQSGRGIVQDLSDLDELLSAITSAKSNWLNKGGFTPSQLVFGHLPRVPGGLRMTSWRDKDFWMPTTTPWRWMKQPENIVADTKFEKEDDNSP